MRIKSHPLSINCCWARYVKMLVAYVTVVTWTLNNNQGREKSPGYLLLCVCVCVCLWVCAHNWGHNSNSVTFLWTKITEKIKMQMQVKSIWLCILSLSQMPHLKNAHLFISDLNNVFCVVPTSKPVHWCSVLNTWNSLEI